MIIRIKCISNDNVQVTIIDHPSVIIVVAEPRTNKAVEFFAGMDGLPELFRDFEDNFSEQVDVQTTIKFFKNQRGFLVPSGSFE